MITFSGFSNVALRKESVDRNIKDDVSYNIKETSLSARRAWIEIRKELNLAAFKGLSLSARRAWIEISLKSCTEPLEAVALRKESVDRNANTMLNT